MSVRYRSRLLQGLLLTWLSAGFSDAPLAIAQPQTTPSSASSLAASLSPSVTATLEPARVAPGESAQLRVTVLVPTFMPRPVEFPSLDQPNLRVQLPERATTPISQTLEGRTWSGITRRYQVTPLAAGEFTLGQGQLGISFQDPETSETVTQSVALAPQSLVAVVPEGAAGLSPYIAGTSLTLSQRLSVTRAGGDSRDATTARDTPSVDVANTAESPDGSDAQSISLAVGDSLQREIVMSLEGGSALLLPPLAPADPVPAMAVHAASPTFTETPNGGSRTERLTYIAQHGGEVTLPGITLQWYDLESQRVASVSVASVAIAIEGAPVPVATSESFLRQYGKPGIAILVLGVAVGSGWRWLWPLGRRLEQRRRWQRERSGVAALKRLERQVGARRFSESLIAWQALEQKAPWLPESRCQEINRCLTALGRERYAAEPHPPPSDGSWHALQRALPHVADLRQERRKPPLPPLNPRIV